MAEVPAGYDYPEARDSIRAWADASERVNGRRPTHVLMVGMDEPLPLTQLEEEDRG